MSVLVGVVFVQRRSFECSVSRIDETLILLSCLCGNCKKVAIKEDHDVFEHISDAIRILREVKLLRLLWHPDIVEIKRIMLPLSKREFRDIFIVFELMESYLHQVIKANAELEW
ncbi:Mitogen-activated protein kinase 18 [Linum perenne]